MEKYYLIDTDIGDDIDDAFALALAVKKGLNLVAVTTVFRNTHLRAQQAVALLQSLNSPVPVYAGAGMPLGKKIRPFAVKQEGDPLTVAPCQYDEGLANLRYEQMSAVDQIIQLAKTYGKQLVIVAIGPMTNVATAIQCRPDVMKNIDKIVCMAGRFEKLYPEWNVACDPEAMDIVLSSGIPVFAVGLDVTLQCKLDDELMQRIKNSDKPYNKLIATWLDRWFNFFHHEKSVLHDPLAIATLFDDVCAFEKRYVQVELSDTPQKGSIYSFTQSKQGLFPINVATKVDSEKFYSLFKKSLL